MLISVHIKVERCNKNVSVVLVGAKYFSFEMKHFQKAGTLGINSIHFPDSNVNKNKSRKFLPEFWNWHFRVENDNGWGIRKFEVSGNGNSKKKCIINQFFLFCLR